MKDFFVDAFHEKKVRKQPTEVFLEISQISQFV